MIFLSQSGLTDPSREKAWAAWYADRLRIMVTVPGITSAQRFTTATPGHPPSLAMYSVASATLFVGWRGRRDAAAIAALREAGAVISVRP
jgi:hypothetical protein